MNQLQPHRLGSFLHPTPETFAGQFITLTPVDVANDVEELFAGSHEPGTVDSMWRYMPVGPFPSARAMGEWLRKQQALSDMIPFTVTDNNNGRRIGSISLMNIRTEHGVAELGFIWYVPSAQRTKANTEASYQLLRYCFESLGYRRMEWKCDAANEPSQCAARRLGFTLEGAFRQHMIVKGKNRDTAWFALLDHEWLRIGAAMRRWLYEDDSIPLSTLTKS